MALGLIFALSTTVDAAAQQTVTLEETNWAALSDASVYHYAWYDPADLKAVRAWVNGSTDDLPDKVSYPLVVQDENGVYGPNGPGFYPQEIFQGPYGFDADPDNWIADPGTFHSWYAIPGWPGEMWPFVHPHHLYAIIQQEARFQTIDPATFLSTADLGKYERYKVKRDRLEALRADYRATVRDAFDGFDLQRIVDAMRDNPTGTVVLDGDFYIGRTLSNGEPGDSRYPHFPFDKAADVPEGVPLWAIDWEFAGTLRGVHDASIQTLPGATFEAPVMVVFGFDPALGTAPASLTIADLSFALTEPNAQFEHHGQPSNYGTILAIPARTKEVHVTLDHVEANGLISDAIYGGWSGRSPLFGITAGRTIGGSLDLNAVTVRDTSLPVFPSFLVDSTFTMTGGHLENNTTGIAPYWLDGTTSEISGNTTWQSPIFTTLGWESPAAAQSSYLIANNDLYVDGLWWSGVEIHGVPGSQPRIVIDHNRFVSPSHQFPWGPLFTDNSNGVEVHDNTFSGAGPAAAYLEAAPDFAGYPCEGTGYSVHGNDFGAFDSYVDLVLGSGSSDFSVVGSIEDTFLDLGTDNVIVRMTDVETGLSSLPPPQGPPAGQVNHKADVATRIGGPR